MLVLKCRDELAEEAAFAVDALATAAALLELVCRALEAMMGICTVLPVE